MIGGWGFLRTVLLSARFFQRYLPHDIGAGDAAFILVANLQIFLGDALHAIEGFA